MKDFIAFFRKHDEDSHFECFIEFYEENFPHFTLIQMRNYHKNLTEPEFNSFFESSPSKIQKDFIDFCYVSLEEHNFAPESLWIMPQDIIPPIQNTSQNTSQNTIQNTSQNNIDPDYDDMPPLEGDMPPLEGDMPPLEGDMPPLEEEVPIPPGEETSNVWGANWKPHQDSQLYDEDSSDEMPPLLDEEIPLEGNPIAISCYMTADPFDEMPALESDEETTFDEMPSLESDDDYEIVD